MFRIVNRDFRQRCQAETTLAELRTVATELTHHAYASRSHPPGHCRPIPANLLSKLRTTTKGNDVP